MIQAVIFDNDGVIVDSHGTYFNVFRKELKDTFGTSFTLQDFKKYGGMRYEDALKKLLQERGMQFDEQQVKELTLRGREKYLTDFYKYVPIHEGAIELIKALKQQGFKIGIGTNGGRDSLTKIYQHNGIYDLFDAIVTYSEAPRGKPFPDIFLTCAKLLDVPAKACVVIEDTDTGIEAAKRAGMKVIAVTTSQDKELLMSAGADVVVESLKDVEVSLIRNIV